MMALQLRMPCRKTKLVEDESVPNEEDTNEKKPTDDDDSLASDVDLPPQNKS